MEQVSLPRAGAKDGEQEGHQLEGGGEDLGRRPAGSCTAPIRPHLRLPRRAPGCKAPRSRPSAPGRQTGAPRRGAWSLRNQTVDLFVQTVGAREGGCWARMRSKRRLGGGAGSVHPRARRRRGAGGASSWWSRAREKQVPRSIKSKLHHLVASCCRPRCRPPLQAPSLSVKQADTNAPTWRVRGGPRQSLTPGLDFMVAREVMAQVGGRPGWARCRRPLAEAGCWRCEVQSRRQPRWRVQGVPLRMSCR